MLRLPFLIALLALLAGCASPQPTAPEHAKPWPLQTPPVRYAE